MGFKFRTFSEHAVDIRHFLAHDLRNPSGYVVICFLGVLGLALFGVKF